MRVEQETCYNLPLPKKRNRKPTILNRVVRENLTELVMLEQRFEGGECIM